MHTAAPQKIVLAGRTFVPVGESTVEHDIEVMRLLRAAGLEMEPAAREADGAGEAEGLDVLTALVQAGVLLPLVACLILPEERSARRAGALARWLERVGLLRREAVRGGWSPEVQAETVAFLGRLDEPADKQRVYGIVAQLLFPFVTGAPHSWRLSRRSSGAMAAVAPAAVGSPPGAGATFNPGVN